MERMGWGGGWGRLGSNCGGDVSSRSNYWLLLLPLFLTVILFLQVKLVPKEVKFCVEDKKNWLFMMSIQIT